MKNIQDEMRIIQEDIDMTNNECADIQGSVEESITKRQMTFEMLLQVQKKLNIYTDLSKGRTPHMLYKTESGLTMAYNKEVSVNSKLSKIVENLQADFPNHVHELTRIFNTLKLPVYVYFQ